MSVTLELQGFEEVIALLEGMGVPSRLGAIAGETVSELVQTARSLTPVDTGAMRNAWTGRTSGLEGIVSIDPAAVNPRSGMLVSSYAPVIDKRVGISNALFIKAGRIGVSLLEEIEWVLR